MPKERRAKSPLFQQSMARLRRNRSYQAFLNAIVAKSGISFSRSYLKRVEDGELAPNPQLLYALELLAGGTPSRLLAEATAAESQTAADTPSDTESEANALLSPSADGKDPVEPMGRNLGAHSELPSKREIESVLNALRSAADRLDETATRAGVVVETLTGQMAELDKRLTSRRKTRADRRGVAGQSHARGKPRR